MLLVDCLNTARNISIINITAVIQVLRYIKGKVTKVIIYGTSAPLSPIWYCDSDWAVCIYRGLRLPDFRVCCVLNIQESDCHRNLLLRSRIFSVCSGEKELYGYCNYFYTLSGRLVSVNENSCWQSKHDRICETWPIKSRKNTTKLVTTSHATQFIKIYHYSP